MDSDLGGRLPPSSSEFAALATLLPPSLILSPSELSMSITSGHIPILLDGLEVSTVQRFSSANTFDGRRLNLRESLYDSHLLHSNSSATVGTFGPVQQLASSTDYQVADESPKDSVPWPTTTFLRLNSHTNSGLSAAADSSINNLPNASWSQVQPLARESYINLDNTGSRMANTRLLEGNARPSTPEYHRARLPPKQLADCRAEALSFDQGRNEMKTNLRCRSDAAGDRSKPDISCESPSETVSASLHNIRVVLSIDQEGFRSINPSFRFVRCTKQAVGEKLQPRDMAQFVAIDKEVFHFHYAPLDGLPVVRRISVNNDENHDYISREATLVMKSNGIYIVYGVEPVNRSVHNEVRRRHSIPELYWEFMYKVDARREGPSRKLVDGERNFTPISFSCSPAFLHPNQGKKFNLIHVVKKRITARLTAEKVQLTEVDRKLGNCLPSSAKLPFREAVRTDMHRRALSCGRQQEHSAIPRAKLFPQELVLHEKRNAVHSHYAVQSARRRRASSAGEWKASDKQTPNKMMTHTSTSTPPLQKHIVPPAQLARMLDFSAPGESSSAKCCASQSLNNCNTS